MDPLQIVLCFPADQQQVTRIRRQLGERAIVIASDQSSISTDIFEADIFCGHAKVPIDWEQIVEAGRLKWIQSTAAGLDHCLTEPVVRSQIQVSGCSGLFADQVAEQTMSLLFGLLRKLPTFINAQQRREFARLPTDELTGKTVGVIGFGGNGQRIAQMLRPIAGKMLATDCFADQLHMQGVEILPPEGIQEVSSRSEVVIVTLPLTRETEGLVDRECLMAMPRGAYLVNVGRGSVVDQTALVELLQSGHLAGAGLDVVQPEPLPDDDPLWTLDNVIITPHVGAQSRWRIPNTIDLFLDNLERFLAGESLVNLVDKQLGFPTLKHRMRLVSRV